VEARGRVRRQKANSPRTSDDEAKKLLAHSNDMKVRASGLDATIEQLDMRAPQPGARGEEGRPQPEGSGRVKLKKEWIPVWLKDPHQWREGTKMPSFGWTMARFARFRRSSGRPA